VHHRTVCHHDRISPLSVIASAPSSFAARFIQCLNVIVRAPTSYDRYVGVAAHQTIARTYIIIIIVAEFDEVCSRCVDGKVGS